MKVEKPRPRRTRERYTDGFLRMESKLEDVGIPTNAQQRSSDLRDGPGN